MVKKKMSPGSGTRRKIAIEKIKDEDARHVCFSKRRNGLFTKASVLATLCGAKVAIIIKSIADNLYSFGSPDLCQVIDRYLADGAAAAGSGAAEKPSQCVSALRLLNGQAMTLGEAVETAMERKSAIDQRQEVLSQKSDICRLVVELHHVELNDLEKLKKSLEVLRATVMGRIDDLAREAASSTVTTNANWALLASKIGNEHTFF